MCKKILHFNKLIDISHVLYTLLDLSISAADVLKSNRVCKVSTTEEGNSLQAVRKQTVFLFYENFKRNEKRLGENANTIRNRLV